MTTLVAFVSVDSHGPTAFYLGSDSRITWGNQRRWDAGRKVFACQRHPHIFGYCGDVVFPSLVLSQIIELADMGALFDDAETPEARHLKVASTVKASFRLNESRRPCQSFEIIHVSRRGRANKSCFTVWQLSFDGTRWSDRQIDVSISKSNLVVALGTGAAAIHRHQKQWLASEQGGTSRSVFSAFCDSLASGNDRASGGPPQLVGIYRDGPAKSIGIVQNKVRYFCGLPVPEGISFVELEWRDELFQRIDGETMGLASGAQRHVRPKRG